jgi:hypothetical protein
MRPLEFVALVRKIIRDSASEETLTVLRKVPGKRPSPTIITRSNWYNSLKDEDKKILASIILDVADRTVFGFLCVLDGVRAIESDPDKGRLELRYIKGADSILLNSTEDAPLHELWT